MSSHYKHPLVLGRQKKNLDKSTMDNIAKKIKRDLYIPNRKQQQCTSSQYCRNYGTNI